MAFTYTASSTGSTLQTETVSIEVSPASGVIAATMLPGDSVSGTINVSNTGTVDEYYFITADWKAADDDTTPSLAALLAYNLNVSVAVGGTDLFAGKLEDLIDRPDSPGRELTLTTANEDVSFNFTLPTDAGNAVQDIDLAIDFVFVATS
ncbi:hypothetical protein [Tepidanaerobacter sp. EBM-38]|jgi:hypothetical protein|uniref:hypothetical protein n=1 Tax=Tepidanaerobacter sp. EBM-38 TaxID=1918496 RepID=UPI000A8DCA0D|nr:hypothetical protein [Tepidanaerobacter sp. EBM-38]